MTPRALAAFLLFRLSSPEPPSAASTDPQGSESIAAMQDVSGKTYPEAIKVF